MNRVKAGMVTSEIAAWMRDNIDPALIWQSEEGQTIFQDYDNDGHPIRGGYVIVWAKNGGSLLKKYVPSELLAIMETAQAPVSSASR